MFEGSHHQRNLGYWSQPAGRSPHHVTAAAITVPVRSRNPSFLLLAPTPPHPCLRFQLQNSSWRRVRVGIVLDLPEVSPVQHRIGSEIDLVHDRDISRLPGIATRLYVALTDLGRP